MPTAARPLFLNNPIRWTKWFAYTHPTWFWSLFFPINAIGALVWAPPLQRYFGVIHPAPIPRSYPSMCQG